MSDPHRPLGKFEQSLDNLLIGECYGTDYHEWFYEQMLELGNSAKQEEGNNPMKKTWHIITSPGKYETYDAAVEYAKRYAKTNQYDVVYVTEVVAVIKTPVPEYEVVKL